MKVVSNREIEISAWEFLSIISGINVASGDGLSTLKLLLACVAAYRNYAMTGSVAKSSGDSDAALLNMLESFQGEVRRLYPQYNSSIPTMIGFSSIMDLENADISAGVEAERNLFLSRLEGRKVVIDFQKFRSA